MQFTVPWKTREDILNGRNEVFVEQIIFCYWPRRITGTNRFVWWEYGIEKCRYWRGTSYGTIWKDMVTFRPMKQQ
jgi:hypothetical protein